MDIFIREYNKKRSIWITDIEIKNMHEQAESSRSLHEQAIHVVLQHSQ